MPPSSPLCPTQTHSSIHPSRSDLIEGCELFVLFVFRLDLLLRYRCREDLSASGISRRRGFLREGVQPIDQTAKAAYGLAIEMESEAWQMRGLAFLTRKNIGTLDLSGFEEA